MIRASIRMLVRWLVDWVRDLMQPPGAPNVVQPLPRQQVLATIAQIASGTLSSLIAAWIVQSFLSFNFEFVVILAFVLFFVISALLQVRFLPLRLSAFWVFTVLLIAITIESVALAFLYATTRPPTVYLVLDATEKAKPSFTQLLYNVRYSASVQTLGVKEGIRVYGGEGANKLSCKNTQQLIAPIPSKDYKNGLGLILPNLVPGGTGSLTIAVLDAIKNDLKHHAGPITLIVITSGIDPNCDSFTGDVFERIAKDVNEDVRKDITIAVISVGEKSDNESSVLQSYANAFNGTYLNAANPDQLPALLLAPSNYFSGYAQRATPTPSPTR